MEIVRMAVSPDDAKNIKLSDYIIKFDKQTDKPKREMTPEEKKAYIYQQKCLFGGIFGAPVPKE